MSNLSHRIPKRGEVKYEICSVCEDRTGKAGRYDDSLFCCETGEGPFCDECWMNHKEACAECRKEDGK